MEDRTSAFFGSEACPGKDLGVLPSQLPTAVSMVHNQSRLHSLDCRIWKGNQPVRGSRRQGNLSVLQWRRVTSWRQPRQVVCYLWPGLSVRLGVNCSMSMGTVHQWDTCAEPVSRLLSSWLQPFLLYGYLAALAPCPPFHRNRESATLLASRICFKPWLAGILC